MRSLHHFILTNFNVRIPGVTVDQSGGAVRTRSWLDGRIALFETFCLPSLAGQSCQNFEWLVRFEVDTPADVRERISRWQKSVRLTPVWNEASVQTTIAERVRSNTSVIVTTRLDSDDGLHREHVALIQSEIGEPRAEVLCPTHGYSLQYPEGEVRLSRDPLSAFITLVDPVTGPPTRTVRSVQHREAAALAPLREIGEHALWLQVAHGRNLWNRPNGAPCSIDGVREAFNLKPDVPLREASEVGASILKR